MVRDLSMQVKRGTIYGFLGPNGSGKTTTIRMLCGLLTPDEGTGTCLGYDILTETDKIKRQVGYMTQRFSLYQDLSVRENLEFIARIYGIEKPAAAARAAIERLGLTGREEQLAGELSGGWKQRLALGACTLPSPQLAAARRADRRRRSQGAARVLERDPRARRRRPHRAGLHPLHGRGRALSRDRLYRLWRIAGARHRRAGDRGLASDHLCGERRRRRRGSPSLSEELTGKPGIDMVAPFGTSLHVSGRDAGALEAAIAPYRKRKGLDWKRSEPSLEDVFIDLMSKARDNFQ